MCADVTGGVGVPTPLLSAWDRMFVEQVVLIIHSIPIDKLGDEKYNRAIEKHNKGDNR